MAKRSAAELDDPTPTPAASACQAADALFRAADESVRLHERLGRTHQLGCADNEVEHLARITSLADAHLDAMTTQYEACANSAPEARDEGWWHAANTLWHAGREYRRRNHTTDLLSRVSGKHSKEKFNELAMEFELERSALLSMKQAVQAYRAVRPDRE